VSLRRSISRTHRLINLTPGVNGFGVDGFKIRANSDGGRLDAKNIKSI
jgi:hypothetical protein